MLCERCGDVIIADYRTDPASRKKPQRFCTKFCANQRERTEESKEKVSRALHQHYHTIAKSCKECGKKVTSRNSTGFCKQCLRSSPPKTRYLWLKDFRERRKKELIAYKGGKCIRCGYDRCIAALDFHHRDPTTKEFTLSHTWSKNSRTLEEMKKEVDKCDLLCSNCHREVHYELRIGGVA